MEVEPKNERDWVTSVFGQKGVDELQENEEVKAKEAVLYMYINCEKV